MNLYAGKINLPFYRAGKNELIWDSDLTPEGVAILSGMPLGEKTTANFVTGGFWVNEESTGGDTSLWVLQAYLKHQFSNSDFLGGGTGGEGHRFAFAYVPAKNVALSLTHFDNKYDGRRDDVDYDRLQADIALKF